jgi:hypothetical protein
VSNGNRNLRNLRKPEGLWFPTPIHSPWAKGLPLGEAAAQAYIKEVEFGQQLTQWVWKKMGIWNPTSCPEEK